MANKHVGDRKSPRPGVVPLPSMAFLWLINELLTSPWDDPPSKGKIHHLIQTCRDWVGFGVGFDVLGA